MWSGTFYLWEMSTSSSGNNNSNIFISVFLGGRCAVRHRLGGSFSVNLNVELKQIMMEIMLSRVARDAEVD